MCAFIIEKLSTVRPRIPLMPLEAKCDSCGKQILAGRVVEIDGKTLCYECFDLRPTDM